MSLGEKKFNIGKNIHIIESLKSEILSEVSSVFSITLQHTKEIPKRLADILPNIILLTYLLGKRLGISYQAMDLKIQSKLKIGILENHESIEWHSDLTELSRHLDKTRDKY